MVSAFYEFISTPQQATDTISGVLGKGRQVIADIVLVLQETFNVGAPAAKSAN